MLICSILLSLIAENWSKLVILLLMGPGLFSSTRNANTVYLSCRTKQDLANNIYITCRSTNLLVVKRTSGDSVASVSPGEYLSGRALFIVCFQRIAALKPGMPAGWTKPGRRAVDPNVFFGNLAGTVAGPCQAQKAIHTTSVAMYGLGLTVYAPFSSPSRSLHTQKGPEADAGMPGKW